MRSLIPTLWKLWTHSFAVLNPELYWFESSSTVLYCTVLNSELRVEMYCTEPRAVLLWTELLLYVETRAVLCWAHMCSALNPELYYAQPTYRSCTVLYCTVLNPEIYCAKPWPILCWTLTCTVLNPGRKKRIHFYTKHFGYLVLAPFVYKPINHTAITYCTQKCALLKSESHYCTFYCI